MTPAGCSGHPRTNLSLFGTISNCRSVSGKPNRRESFQNVKEMAFKIERFVDFFRRRKAKPFVWTATADSIFEKKGR
jgi:hypothetical protein